MGSSVFSYSKSQTRVEKRHLYISLVDTQTPDDLFWSLQYERKRKEKTSVRPKSCQGNKNRILFTMLKNHEFNHFGLNVRVTCQESITRLLHYVSSVVQLSMRVNETQCRLFNLANGLFRFSPSMRQTKKSSAYGHLTFLVPYHNY